MQSLLLISWAGNYTDSQRIGNTELICKDNTKLLSVLIKLIANNDSLHIQFVNQCKSESITVDETVCLECNTSKTLTVKHYCSKLWCFDKIFVIFFKDVSYAHRVCLYF